MGGQACRCERICGKELDEGGAPIELHMSYMAPQAQYKSYGKVGLDVDAMVFPELLGAEGGADDTDAPSPYADSSSGAPTWTPDSTPPRSSGSAAPSGAVAAAAAGLAAAVEAGEAGAEGPSPSSLCSQGAAAEGSSCGAEVAGDALPASRGACAEEPFAGAGRPPHGPAAAADCPKAAASECKLAGAPDRPHVSPMPVLVAGDSGAGMHGEDATAHAEDHLAAALGEAESCHKAHLAPGPEEPSDAALAEEERAGAEAAGAPAAEPELQDRLPLEAESGGTASEPSEPEESVQGLAVDSGAEHSLPDPLARTAHEAGGPVGRPPPDERLAPPGGDHGYTLHHISLWYYKGEAECGELPTAKRSSVQSGPKARERTHSAGGKGSRARADVLLW